MKKALLIPVIAAGLAVTPFAAIAQNLDFATVDSDGSGDVSLVELQAAFPDDEVDDTVLARYDTDGSGGLSPEEFELAVTSLGPLDADDEDDDGEGEGEEPAE